MAPSVGNIRFPSTNGFVACAALARKGGIASERFDQVNNILWLVATMIILIYFLANAKTVEVKIAHVKDLKGPR